jgi:hypothetical protein
MPHRIRIRALGAALAGLVCCGAPLRAQVQVGSETQLNLNGNISAGYSGSMSNEGPDSHGLDFGGMGNLNGYFHSPQFLSFDVAPFFNQSRANSNYQSISDASGVTASANIFSGSQFPGHFSFSKTFNSESTYSLPGIANYATNSNSQTFGVGWSANLKNLPSLTFGYQQGSNDYSLYGAQQDSFSDFHSAFANANYTVDGFHLSGGIHYSNASSLFPQIVAGEPGEKASSDSTTYTLGMGRSLPLSGSTWFNFTRNSTGYDASGFTGSESADIVNGGFAFKPTSKLSTQFSVDYDDNIAGTILQTVNAAGAITPVSFTEAPSHSWGLFGGAEYRVLPGLIAAGTISHRQQLFLGSSFDSTAYSGSVNYGHHLLGGQFTAGATVTQSSYGTSGESMLGLLTNAIYFRRFGAWNVSGSFGYSRNVQTILIAYTSSGYSFSGSASRQIGRLNWNVSASGSKSVLSEAGGTTNFTQGYTTGLSGRWLGASAGYSKSSGTGLITPTGITTLPGGVPPTLVPAILYGGTTYTFGVGSTPIRGLTITGTYVNSRSNTGDGPLSSSNNPASGLLSSNNKTEQAYIYLIYRFRKVYFNAGYNRLLQGFSASGLPPTMVSTYYFGVSRWFKAF